MIDATLRLGTKNERVSRPLVQAVEPDNEEVGLTITGRATRRDATFQILFDGKIETFISTLDDLIQCVQAAERTLNSISNRDRR